MKTKFITILIFISGLTFGQEWSPVGAEWYYDITYAFSGNIDYLKVYCDSIIKFKGVNCKKINIKQSACNIHFSGDLYTFDTNDTIYFYNSDIDSFEILYNFNVLKNDYWKIHIKNSISKLDTVIVKVDSVGETKINNRILKRLFVTYNYINLYKIGDTIKENSEIIQTLGDIKFLINIRDRQTGACDINFKLIKML
jgi:hypothetical protein